MDARSFAVQWEALTRAEGIDPRLHYWRLEADRLLLRSGPAAEAARRLALAWPQGAPKLEVLAGTDVQRVSAARSALRRDPGHAAEQVSQLRLGDRFTVWHHSEDGDWCLGCGEDGYPGWLRSWHLVPGAGPGPDRVVAVRQGRALVEPDPGAETLIDLSLGVRLAARGEPERGFQAWRLPDGREAWTATSELEPWPGAPDMALPRLLERAVRLLGAPYEWGGGAAAGLDCSGLIQLLFGSVGLILPRDADLQALDSGACAPRAEGPWRPGDLLFYGEPRVDHVALLVSLNPVQLLHASGIVKRENPGDGGFLGGRAPQVRLPAPVGSDER